MRLVSIALASYRQRKRYRTYHNRTGYAIDECGMRFGHSGPHAPHSQITGLEPECEESLKRIAAGGNADSPDHPMPCTSCGAGL